MSNYLFGVTEEDITKYRKTMDPRTFDLFEELLTREDEYRGNTPWPYVQLGMVLNDIRAGYSVDRFYGNRIKRNYFEYGGRKSTYAEWYRVLGYVIYGYGNLSNNDRKRSGKRTKRFVK